MKIAIVITFCINFFSLSYAQSMKTIFYLLPKKYTPELTFKQRDTLLKNKEYIIPGGDTIETDRYTIEVDESKEYLRYEFGFTTGQNGFAIYEIRKFKRKDGTSLIVFSNYAGSGRSYFQTEVTAFNYQHNKLVEIKNKLLPQEIEIKQFLKPGTPDSIRSKLESYTSSAYDLDPKFKKRIMFRLFFEIINGEDEKYIMGDSMIFTWTGKSFKQSKITNSD